jgi:hypothetical protein
MPRAQTQALKGRTSHSQDSTPKSFFVPSVDSLRNLFTAPVGGFLNSPPGPEPDWTPSSVASADASIFAGFLVAEAEPFTSGSLFLLFEKSSTSVFWLEA